MIIESTAKNKILCWSDFNIKDYNKNPIKKLTLVINSGDIAKLKIEEYLVPTSKGGKKIPINKHKTVTRNYAIDDLFIKTKGQLI